MPGVLLQAVRTGSGQRCEASLAVQDSRQRPIEIAFATLCGPPTLE